jgi:hypothetical protein
MITFKQYLTEELVKTKRKSITHLQDMKPIQALEFLHSIASELKGKLKNIPIQIKADGLGARVGKDSKGKYFFETSNSGPIQKSKAFSTFTKEKGGDEVSMTRSLHYDDMYDEIEKSGIWKMLPTNSKLVVEIMYNPMAIEQDDKLKFVSVKYDKSKLGTLMTIVPIAVLDASTSEHLEDEQSIIKEFIKQSTPEIKIVSADLGKMTIDVSAELDSYSLIGPDAEYVLKSLKKVDKEKKAEYKQIISQLLNNLATSILAHPIKGKDILGDEIEGYVLDINGKLFKVTTPKFKQQKRDERQQH